jgi:hypothetical protein
LHPFLPFDRYTVRSPWPSRLRATNLRLALHYRPVSVRSPRGLRLRNRLIYAR